MTLMMPGFSDALREIRIIDWSTEPWVGACYSFPAPGEVMAVMPILRQGIGKLHFAGEHCSSAFVGYMEGAIESGIRVADEISKGARLLLG